MALQISKRDLLAHTLNATGCARVLRAARPWNGVLIWNYHRIGNASGSLFDPHLFSATAEDFDRQVAFLKQNFDLIGPSDLEHSLRQPRGQFVMLTFDDGYRDNYSLAYPILKSHGVSATFFITTGFLDRPHVPAWDEIAWMLRMTSVKTLTANEWLPTSVCLGDQSFQRLLAVYKSLGTELTEAYLDFLADSLGTGRCPNSLAHDQWMTWDMLRELQACGMSFGGHTVNHPILANATADQQDWEVGECRRRLIDELGVAIDAFSYPNGRRSDFNEFTRAALRNHGYRWAFSYSGGHCRPGHADNFDLSRTAVESDLNLSLFRVKATLPQFFG